MPHSTLKRRIIQGYLVPVTNQFSSTQLETIFSRNVFNMRFSSIVVILALASNQATSGQGVAGAPRRRAQEVDIDVTLDDSPITPIEPITDDPTDQPTTAPDFTEWVATAEPTSKPSGLPTTAPAQPTSKPSGLPTSAPAEPTSKPSGIPTSSPVKTSSLVINEATIALPTEEAIAWEPSFAAYTVSPAAIDCVDYARDFNGGNIEDYCHTLDFEYEVKTMPTLSLFALEQSLIPSVEDAIMDSLTPLVVGECSNDEGVRHLLSDRNIDMLHNAMSTHRRAQIFGLGASPADTRRGGSTCQSTRTSPNHRCFVVSGAVTVCSTNFAKDKAEVMNAIREGMEDDAYNDAHEAIVELFFIGEDAADAKEETEDAGEQEDIEEEQPNVGSDLSEDSPLSAGRENGDDSSSSNRNESNSARDSVTITHPLQGAKLWGVLLGVIAAILTFVLLGKKLAEDKEHDCANDGGGDKVGASETSGSEDGGEQV